MQRWAVVAALLGFAACHSVRNDPPATPPTTATPSPTGGAAPRIVADFVPSVDARNRSYDVLPTASDTDGGWLVDGIRVAADGDAFGADGPVDQPVVGGARIPKRLGGGFLFYTARGLYSASTFLGKLEPIMSLALQPSDIHFADGYGLITFTSGGRLPLGLPKKQRIPLPAVGFIDAATLEDGRGVMLLEPQRVRVTKDGGKSWKDVDVGPVHHLIATPTELWLMGANNRPRKLETSGVFAEYQRLPEDLVQRQKKKFDDPRWPLDGDPPLQRAIRNGAPAGPAVAWVEAKGQFFKIDLGTGAISGLTRSVTTTDGDCGLLPVKGDVLALCRRSSQNDAIAISGIGAGTPKVEYTFPKSSRFFSDGAGGIVFDGPCQPRATDKTPEDSVRACARGANGTWRELAQRVTPGADAGTNAPQLPVIARFVPNGDSAVALTLSPTAGIFDLKTGVFTAFTSEDYKKRSDLGAGASDVFEDKASLTADGSLSILVNDGGVKLGRDGSIQHSSQVFSRVEGAGPRALGIDRDNRLWQTEDHGRTWNEVDRPIAARKRSSLSSSFRCSYAGCDFGAWYRLGYPTTTPRNRELAPAPATPTALDGPLPRLACTSTAPARTKFVARSVDRDGNPTDEYDIGANKFRLPLNLVTFPYPGTNDSAPRATTLLDPNIQSGPGQPFLQAVTTTRLVRYTEPLQLDGPLGIGKFNWQQVFSLSAKMGFDAGTNTEVSSAVPVLSDTPGTGNGILAVLDDEHGIFLWAHAGRSTLLTVGPENAGFSPISAASKKTGELTLLTQDSECAARVLEFDPKGRVRALFSLPRRPSTRPCAANTDTLAILPDGSAAVIRAPSNAPPSSDDPALLLQPGKAPVALAPWSTLSAFEQCASDAAAARTLFSTTERWVALSHPNADETTPGMLAALRWSPTRVCAEALEIASGTQDVGDRSLEMHVVAKLAPPAGASRRGIGLGGELTEAASCKLQNP